MSPGQIARKILGPAFRPAGEAYRRIFVDMARVADWFAAQLPPNARVLDIGGGDGYVVNLLLERRRDVVVTMTDIAPQIGTFIAERNRSRVRLFPGAEATAIDGQFDVITLADVVHHVPASQRGAFFSMLGAVANRTGANSFLIKDIRPGNLRAKLALWGDIYITGDRHVLQVPEGEIGIPGFHRTASAMPDFPNYCIALSRGANAGRG
jgi:SAM-dependent methyltransferase